MLEQLPWPRHLKRVPEYAGGHHERMDGKGYPKGLKRDEMSVQARMMGIADIFEALRAQLALRPCVDAPAEALLASHCEAAQAAIDSDRTFLRTTNKGAEFMNDAAIARVQAIANQRVWRNEEGEVVPFLTANELENLSIRGGTLT